MARESNFSQSVQAYMEALGRLRHHRRFIALLFTLGLSLTATVVYHYPVRYQASTLILIQEQRMPVRYVESSISVDLSERLQTLTPQIMSRARLEGIIERYDLYLKPDSPPDMESRVEIMRKAIDVQVKGHDTFRVYFKDRSPQVAQQVVADLANLFIEENLRDRARQALDTSEFIESELGRLKRKLDVQEAELREFKERHIGQLPEQQNANLRALDRFQAQQQVVARALIDANSRKMALEAQLLTQSDDVDSVSDETLSVPHIERMRARLKELRAVYTDRHPDIRTLTKRVAEAEAKLEHAREAGIPLETLKHSDSLHARILRVNREIEQLESEQAVLARDMARYHRRIERLPAVEEKLAILTRDYETTRQYYESLLNKRFEAELSVNLEEMQRETAFKIVDPSFLPENPLPPSRAFLGLFGLLMSLGMAVGIGFIKEMLTTVVRQPQDLEGVVNAPVLAVIPHIGVSSGAGSVRRAAG